MINKITYRIPDDPAVLSELELRVDHQLVGELLVGWTVALEGELWKTEAGESQ